MRQFISSYTMWKTARKYVYRVANLPKWIKHRLLYQSNSAIVRLENPTQTWHSSLALHLVTWSQPLGPNQPKTNRFAWTVKSTRYNHRFYHLTSEQLFLCSLLAIYSFPLPSQKIPLVANVQDFRRCPESHEWIPIKWAGLLEIQKEIILCQIL